MKAERVRREICAITLSGGNEGSHEVAVEDKGPEFR
jgi:hypothetical protein